MFKHIKLKGKIKLHLWYAFISMAYVNWVYKKLISSQLLHRIIDFIFLNLFEQELYHTTLITWNTSPATNSNWEVISETLTF